MSLRLRLVLGLLGCAAIGLGVLSVVSFQQQKSFLTKRVDQQVTAAFGPVSDALNPKSGPSPEGSGPGAGAGASDGPGGAGPNPATQQLPPGTYGAFRNAEGIIVDHVLFGYGENLGTPEVKNLPVNRASPTPTLVTVGARHGGGEFRAAAFPDPDTGGSYIVAVPLSEVESSLSHLALIEAIVSAVVLICLAGLAWWVVKLGLRPLAEIEVTAGEIAAGDLTQRVDPANSRTEVGRLGLALNAMLTQIEGAFAQRQQSEARMRRFLADASHELRTPLSSIRGYAELYRIGAASDPADVRKAMGRIEDESVRMGGLVNDLLTLARLDEVREPSFERVDLRQIVVEAVEDARVAAREREISLNESGPLIVIGDADKLKQVVGNLLTNALVHTPPGTSIEVRVSRRQDHAEIEVRDHGRGLGEGADGRVFERFWRESESRSRDQGGSGLGLAVVAAVVSAHGGRVSAENAPGGGARFTVFLPLGETEVESAAD